MLKIVVFLLGFVLVFLDYWALFGIFNDEDVIFRYLNYFGYYIPLLALIIAMMGLWLSRWAASRIFFLIVLMPVLFAPYYLATADFGGDAKSEFSNADASVKNMQSLEFVTFSKMSRNRNYPELAGILDCSKYDIIVVQEISDLDLVLAQTPAIADKCHIAHAGMPEKFLTIFSKYPVTSADADKVASVNIFTVALPGQNIQILTTRLDKTLDQHGLANQMQQAERLALIVDKLQGTVILGGDFNSTPHNYPIYRMKQNLSYAAPEGFLNSTFTFPANGRQSGLLGALIRIDHIFYKNAVLESAMVMPESFGSDHYPIYARFRIPVLDNEVQKSRGSGAINEQ